MRFNFSKWNYRSANARQNRMSSHLKNIKETQLDKQQMNKSWLFLLWFVDGQMPTVKFVTWKLRPNSQTSRHDENKQPNLKETYTSDIYRRSWPVKAIKKDPPPLEIYIPRPAVRIDTKW